MCDLISREAAIEQIERRIKYLVGDKGVSPEAFIRFLRNRPAVDAEPVRHGKWEYVPVGRYQCMECKHYIDVGDDKNYCPNCGVKMDGGAE